jgi:hypothetical protein
MYSSFRGLDQTASHSRFATKSYFVVYAPETISLPAEFDRFIGECERSGVDLIRFGNPKDYDSFEVLVSPERKEKIPILLKLMTLLGLS